VTSDNSKLSKSLEWYAAFDDNPHRAGVLRDAASALEERDADDIERLISGVYE
jgi:hypothetical protein